MSKKKKADDNPLHTEYGIPSNSLYVLGKIRRYCPVLLPLMAVSVIIAPISNLMSSFIGKYVIDIIQVQADSPDKDTAPLLKVIAIAAAVLFSVGILNTVIGNRLWYRFIFARMRVMTERVAKMLSMNYQTLEQPKLLDMHEKAMQATGGNNNGIEGLMRAIFQTGILLANMAAAFISVVILDWRILLVLALISFVQFLFFRHTVKRDKKETWDALAPTWRKLNYMARTTQDFDYAKDIRLFQMKNWLSGKMHGIYMDKQSKMFHSRDLWIYNSIFAHSMNFIGSVFVYGSLIYCVIDRDMSIGDYTLYISLAKIFAGNLNGFLNSIGHIKECSMQTDDFRSFMDLKTEEEGDFIPIPKTDRYSFEFKNVSYKYQGAEDYALKNLNLKFGAGEKLAVVGLNGAGKTTFIKLLLRLYDAAEGEILMNGTDIRRFRREEYYSLFAPVFQNVEIFAFPMSENVSMRPPESTDKELAEKCLVKAGMAEKLGSLEKGVDTQLLKVIYEDGADLSGGEKQKLALARALYKDSPVIVLDEPTAALDALAEYELYKSFDEIIQGKSAVYISHRLSSTRFCDSIAMFKAGEMVEYGSHDELLKKGGAYAEMFEIQAQYYKDGKEIPENV